MPKVERRVLLSIIDRLWVDHLTTMDDLRQGVGLQAYGQKDPLVVYKTEGYRLFGQLLENIQHPVHLVHNVGQAHDGVRELRTKWPFAKLLCFFFHPLCCVWLVDFLLHCTDAVCSLNCVHIAQATRCYYYTYHLSAGTFGVVLLLRISCACKH